MTATNHTEHYELSQYTGNDHPTYTGDYNSDMSKIDAAIYAASQSGGGGMATVEHTADLTGDGTTDSPLGVADTIARTTDIPSLDGYATTKSVTQAIAAAIADRLRAGDIKAGNGINIKTSGNTVTISYVGGGSSGGLTAVAHDNTLTGDGTGANPLGAAIGSALNQGETNNIADLDFNTYVSPGIYGIAAESMKNAPSVNDAVRAILLVSGCGFSEQEGTILQVLFLRNTTRQALGIYMRGLRWGTWDKWRGFAPMDSIPDVSALTSRIATLETKVNQLTSAATPSATGLTAEQLDSQYSDDYNIVRVGTPTQINESEVNPNE